MFNFGEHLKEIRVSRNLTQKQLAMMVGSTERGIQRYESGERKPNFDTATKVADFFDVTVDYLLGNSDVRNPKTTIPTDDDIKFALFGGEKGISDEAYEDVKRFAAFIKDKYKKD